MLFPFFPFGGPGKRPGRGELEFRPAGGGERRLRVGCGAASIREKADLEPAFEEMLAFDGPYLLDIETPYQEQVLPMIPSGATVQDMIKE